jgi:hypothetical protein
VAWNELVRAGVVIRHRNRKEQRGDTFEPAANGGALLAALLGRDDHDGGL